MLIAWDKDLAFWGDGTEQNSHPLHGTEAYPAVYTESDYRAWNHLIDAMLTTPRIKEMYLRRLRTLMDQLLQPSDTPIDQRYFETRIDELAMQMVSDVAQDQARWGVSASSAEALQLLKSANIEMRRVYLYGTHAVEGGLIPPAQSPSVDIRISEVVFPEIGDAADGAYFVLHNDSPQAVDISGWTISGDVEFTFQSGVVLSEDSDLFVAKDVAAFRSLAADLDIDANRFVQGGYREVFADQFGSLLLRDRNGDLIDRISYWRPDQDASPRIFLPIIARQ